MNETTTRENFVKDGKNTQKAFGSIPTNARCYIDYTKTPTEISFEYPDKDTSIIFKSGPTMAFALLFMVLMFVITLGVYTIIFDYPESPPINDITAQILSYRLKGTNITSFEGIDINYTQNGKTYGRTLKYLRGGEFGVSFFGEKGQWILKDPNTYKKLFIAIANLFILLFFMFSYLILGIYLGGKLFINTKWGNKKYPEFNKKMSGEKFIAEITPDKLEGDGKTFTIPLFKNVFVDYELEGDFSKYIQTVKILEHPFSYISKKERKKTNPEKKSNVWLWKCEFKFSKKPLKGKLKIKWT